MTVVAISSSDGGALESFGRDEGIEVRAVDMTRTITPRRDLRTIRCLRRELRNLAPEIVEAHTSKAGLLGMIAARLAGVPVRIYHNHGMALSSARRAARPLLWLAERVACALATEVVYVAPSVRDDAVAKRVCPTRKARVIPSINGLDAEEQFNPDRLPSGTRAAVRSRHGIPAGALVLGFVGRLFKVKGVEQLAAAWDRLAEAYPTLHLLLVGGYDARVLLDPAVVERLETRPRVHFAGHVEDVAPMYAAMDVLVLPSFHEGLGYVLIEASAMRVPVVGTSIPGILDAIEDGVTGTIIAPGSPDEICRAVGRYLDDPDLRVRHGTAGRENIRRLFRREDTWRALEETYGRLARAVGIVRDAEPASSAAAEAGGSR